MTRKSGSIFGKDHAPLKVGGHLSGMKAGGIRRL
jgi:hypothetical protein